MPEPEVVDPTLTVVVLLFLCWVWLLTFALYDYDKRIRRLEDINGVQREEGGFEITSDNERRETPERIP